MNDELKKYLKKLASEPCWSENPNFDPGDGGNHDDTYSSGIDEGYIHLARELLYKFGKKSDEQ